MSAKRVLSILFIIGTLCALECQAESEYNEDRSKRILIENNYYTIISRLDSLTKTVNALPANLTQEIGLLTKIVNALPANLTQEVELLTKEVAALKAANALMSHPPVSFMAYLTTTVTGSNHHIYFDDVKLNMGNAYNPNHGTFVTPVSGTYQFSVTACSAGAHSIGLEIMVNANSLGKMFAGDSAWHSCGSKTFLAHLTTGDDVYVKHGTTGDYLYANPIYGLPSFTGVLLQAH